MSGALAKTSQDKEKTQGRPPIVHRDRARARRIIKALTDGATMDMAAKRGGVSRRTLYEWLYKGQDVRDAREIDPEARLTPYDDDYLWFIEAYEAAETQMKETLLRRIFEAGDDPKKWQANAWILERRWPDEFALRQVVRNDDARRGVFTLNIGGATPQSKKLTNGDAEKEIEVADYEIADD